MIKHIAIIGAGQMGSGIAQVCATAGYKVLLVDLSDDHLTKAQENITKSLDRLITKEVLPSQAKERTLANLSFSEKIENPHSLDLVLEAVNENLDLKIHLFKNLDDLLPPQAIFATNTSSLSISTLASNTARPQQVIGVHFMNPAPLMPLVEIIRGQETSDATYKEIEKMVQHIGKTPVLSHDFPGFIVNRILMPMINEAIFALQDGVATAQDIDIAMRLGTHHPMGPLELADFIGLDTCLSIMQVLHTGFKNDKYLPCPLLEKYVKSGWLGKKSGRGFYEYTKI